MQFVPNTSRRRFLALGAAAGIASLAGCASRRQVVAQPQGPFIPDDVRMMYAARYDEPYPVPAVNLQRLDPDYWRTIVPNTTGERAGVIVVNTPSRYLYLTREDGTAVRYGVGVGRDGFRWSGRGYVGRKAQWPVWTPTNDMIEREPHLEEFRNGMEPGPENPLGARALYIYEDGRDTLYRLHGNPVESSIGQAVSSGCIRLLQQDVIDLYTRVPVGTPVIVQQ